VVNQVRAFLENHQIAVYFSAIAIGALAAFAFPQATALEPTINPALALMLFVTFLQVPLSGLLSSFRSGRFLAALLLANFALMPVITAMLLWFLPDDPLLRFGVLLVLLTPCIDYVVTFTHLGKGDAKLLLAATPLLLILQMCLLPVYLRLLLGDTASGLVQPGPFLHAFVWLIAVPLLMAALVQVLSAKSGPVARFAGMLGVLPVPATALVLFLVIASVMPRVSDASSAALTVLPIYIVYAALAPLIGWLVARSLRVNTPAARAVAFSAATRNSLVVLPLAFAVPGGVPVLPAVIVTQTIVELLCELVYVRCLPLLPARNS
jgi:ACR3 family arsenite efflux pump ArsB